MTLRTVAKVYTAISGSVLDHLIDRHTGRRSENAVRNSVRKGVKAWAEEEFGAPVKVHWDRKAGCACGCSAGFRVKKEVAIPPHGLRLEEILNPAVDRWAGLEKDGTVEVRNADGLKTFRWREEEK